MSTPEIEQYRAALKAADWGFEYRDRNDEPYMAARAEFQALRLQQMKLDPTGQIWDEYRPANSPAAWKAVRTVEVVE